ncbi:MAG: hypothetical protein CR975_04220 [Gammaproteobacteria bacterium]|nr:MAG: hypothetical protein CR975_04220 [Gammaproteobacteria bacterium]
MSLFRQQVLNQQANKLFGEVILIRPLSFALLTTALAVIVAVVIIFLLYGKYGRRETVNGYLSPDKGLVNVYAPYLGIVERMPIREGQTVKKGEVLYHVSTDFRMSEHFSNNEKLLRYLKEEKNNLQQTITLEKTRFNEEQETLTNQLRQLKKEIAQINQQIKTAKQELQLAEKLWKKYQRLRKNNLVVESALTQQHYNYLAKRSAVQNIKQLLVSKTTDLQTTNLQLEQLPTRRNIRLQELQSQQLTLAERLTNTSSERGYDIISPIDGKVSTVIAKRGQKIDLNTPLLTILPEDSILQAELFLPSRSIGFTEVGQTVLMRYEAFPYQRYGLANGTIEEISKTVINPREVRLAIGTDEPVYRVKVKLDKQSMLANGKPIFLQPGMRLSADILLEKRSLFEWLLEPIYSLRGRL